MWLSWRRRKRLLFVSFQYQPTGPGRVTELGFGSIDAVIDFKICSRKDLNIVVEKIRELYGFTEKEITVLNWRFYE